MRLLKSQQGGPTCDVINEAGLLLLLALLFGRSAVAASSLSNTDNNLENTDFNNILYKFNELLGSTAAVAAAAFTRQFGVTLSTPSTPVVAIKDLAGTPVPVEFAHSELPENSACLSVDGVWRSINLYRDLEVKSSTTVNYRLDIRVADSGWTGTGEELFGDRGPISAFISDPESRAAATFVGNCRVVGGVDTIIGVWVFALPYKNHMDRHLGTQPIPDTLHRLSVAA